MSKSNRGGSFGRRSGGTVTVIEEPVRRSYGPQGQDRVLDLLVITAALTATVAASKWHPILALLAGMAIGRSSPPSPPRS